jgi:sugar phosphate isomerase/epimerase
MYAGDSLETALRELAAAGFGAVDLWAAPRSCQHVDPLTDDPDRLCQLLADLGLRPAALSVDGSDVTRTLASIDFAAAIKAPVVVTGAGARALPDVATHLRPLLKRAAARGVVVALGNRTNTALESLAELQDLLSALDAPSLGIAYAPAHSYVCGESPEIVVQALGARIAFLCAGDVPPRFHRGSRESFWVEPEGQVPGAGCLDFASILRALRQAGYQGYADVVWFGAESWDLPRITAALRSAARFLAGYLG